MKKVLVIIAMCSFALFGTTAADANSGLRATVSPSKPAKYATVTAKLTGGKPRTSYYCTLTVWKKGIAGGASLANTTSIVTVKTNSSGSASCRQTFRPFYGTWQGKKHYCPPRKADKAAGWKCGVGFANANNLKETAAALFTY